MLGLPVAEVQVIFHSPTTEAALQHLRSLDQCSADNCTSWTSTIYSTIAETIDQRVQGYIASHSETGINSTVCGSVLFDRTREIIIKSQTGSVLMGKLC